MEQNFSQAYSIAVELIGHKPCATDEEINSAVSNVSIILPNTDEGALRAELLANYTTSVEDYQILEGKERRTPWLKQFKSDRAQDYWAFWNRYIEYLRKDKEFPVAAIAQTEKLTDDILDRLFDPQMEKVKIAKKGLVVGQVQSGKTANYIGLICKAADAGFNIIIVLAGIHNNLRSQTQTRLDEGFLGFDTQFQRVANSGRHNGFGAGKYGMGNSAIANSITTSEERGDFTKKGADSLGINFHTPTPLLLVVKKNASILKRVLTWLNSVRPGELIDEKSLLIVDDEADNASINTNKKDEEPTAINGLIRNILAKFSKSAYVGYTATPFANIFIPLSMDKDKLDDLFPSDFIINIPAPSNYIGPERVFGTSVIPEDKDISDNKENDLLPIVNTITDYEAFVPTGHKKDGKKPTINDIPESLRTAIKCFIVTCAVRIARGQEKKHNSMLIHVTRYQIWQNAIKDVVEELFNYYKAEIEAEDSGILEEFRKIFEEDSNNYNSYKTVTRKILNSPLKDIDNRIMEHSWDEICPLLHNAVQKIVVKSINGNSSDSLTYYEHEENGISVIAIGGDKLSRGLTLEGLSVSYFLRASKMYDTLMQMGRWFGYRPGYVDLCRLFTSPELNDWFRHITLASEELRAEFNYLYESGETPEKYALKVRTHPGCLQITSLSKRRYTREVQVTWAGRLVETYQLPKATDECRSNLIATENLICGLGASTRPDGRSECYLWKSVAPDTVKEYLSQFKVGKNLVKVNLELICDYISELNRYGELTEWNIALMSRKSCRDKSLYKFRNGLEVNNFYRNGADETSEDTYFIRKNHIVGNQQDEFIDLEPELLQKAFDKTLEIKKEYGQKWEFDFPAPEIVRNEFRPKTTALLMIYPLDAYGADRRNSHTDDPIIGLVLSFPSSKHAEKGITYTVNQIGEYAETEENFDTENDNIYKDE